LLFALAAFGWVYVRPLLLQGREARTSFAGLAPDAARTPPRLVPPPAEAAADAGQPAAGSAATTETRAEAAVALAEPGAQLWPVQIDLWSELARGLEPSNDDPAAQELRGGYGLHVYLPGEGGLSIAQPKLTGARPAPSDIGPALAFVNAQLGRYPRAFMQRIGFQQLVLVAGLKQKGGAAAAFALGPAGAMFADPRALGDEYRFHHELFHFVDYRVHGRPPAHGPWLALNRDGTRYSGSARPLAGAAAGKAAPLTAPRHDLPGFVTAYAQSASEEDMAEVFATLMARREVATELAKSDPVIAAKAQYVRDALDKLAPGTSAALGLAP
jgi:hypothetical protein